MIISRMVIGSAALSAVLASTSAAAAPKEESYCALIRETPEGKFKTDMQPGWSLTREQKQDGIISYDDDVVAISCLRSPATLEPEDAETLSQGKALYFSDPRGPALLTIKYEIVDGKITWSASNGTIPAKQEKAVKKAAERVQAVM